MNKYLYVDYTKFNLYTMNSFQMCYFVFMSLGIGGVIGSFYKGSLLWLIVNVIAVVLNVIAFNVEENRK